MKSNLEAFAKLIATTIWTDGEYDELEKEIVEEIAEAFELDIPKFKAAVEKAVNEIAGMDEAAVNKCLKTTAAEIAKEERGQVFEAVLEISLADQILTEEETENILSISDAMGINRAYAVMLLCDMIKDEPEIEINFD